MDSVINNYSNTYNKLTKENDSINFDLGNSSLMIICILLLMIITLFM